MSANLRLIFEIHNYDRSKEELFLEEAEKFLSAEGFMVSYDEHGDICLALSEESSLESNEKKVFICAYTPHIVSVSRSYLWIPKVENNWESMAKKIDVNCNTNIDVKYMD
jgi:hypothetical protein